MLLSGLAFDGKSYLCSVAGVIGKTRKQRQQQPHVQKLKRTLTCSLPCVIDHGSKVSL